MTLISECDYCGKVDVLGTFMPEKYAVDNYSPSSLSLDELIDVCAKCERRYRVSHDPKIKRRTPPCVPADRGAREPAPYAWM